MGKYTKALFQYLREEPGDEELPEITERIRDDMPADLKELLKVFASSAADSVDLRVGDDIEGWILHRDYGYDDELAEALESIGDSSIDASRTLCMGGGGMGEILAAVWRKGDKEMQLAGIDQETNKLHKLGTLEELLAKLIGKASSEQLDGTELGIVAEIAAEG